MLILFYAGTDKKVWISKGRVIPESDLAYLRPDEAQKKIISDFQKAKSSPNSTPLHSMTTTTEKTEPSAMKVRSKSRLSIKLSKFKSSSNPLKKENSFTYTSHKKQHAGQPGSHPGSMPMTSTSVPSTPIVEDVLNGNQNNFAQHHFDLTQKGDNLDGSQPAKRLSRIGSFLNPNDPEKTSAIVPPFNYSPPNPIQQQQKVNNQLSTAAVRRNDSYLGSMGRPRSDKLKKNLDQKKPHPEQDEVLDSGAPTSSVLVTLV